MFKNCGLCPLIPYGGPEGVEVARSKGASHLPGDSTVAIQPHVISIIPVGELGPIARARTTTMIIAREEHDK